MCHPRNSSYAFASDDFDDLTGDITNRLCTAAEVKFYLNSLMEKSTSANYLKPNKNCNLTSWVSGCEPGWACRVPPSSQKIDLRDSKEMPSRTSNCRACCEGFFCPHGITCMIRKYNIMFKIRLFLSSLLMTKDSFYKIMC
jgi:hypothetical protein